MKRKVPHKESKMWVFLSPNQKYITFYPDQHWKLSAIFEHLLGSIKLEKLYKDDIEIENSCLYYYILKLQFSIHINKLITSM